MLRTNPFAGWVSRQVRVTMLRWRNRHKSLSVGRKVVAKRCEFGLYNTIYDLVWLDRVKIGDASYVSRGTRVINASIGKFSCIGPECLIGLGRHPTHDFISSHPAFYSTREQAQLSFVKEDKFVEFKPITIGNDVWIGARAVVLDGAVIGDGAIVAAGSVVSGGVPPFAVVAGVPAKIVRFRFDESDIKRILESRWWDLELEKLRSNVAKFEDIASFDAWQDQLRTGISGRDGIV